MAVLVLAALHLSVAAAGNGIDEEKAARLAELRAKIRELRVSLDTVRDEKDRLGAELRRTEVEIGHVTRSLERLERRRSEKTAELARLRRRHDEARQALEVHRRMLAEQVMASYLMGRQGYLKIILSQHEPATVGRTLAYYQYFNEARAARIAEIDRQLIEIARLEDDISRQADEVQRLHQKQQRQMRALEDSRRTRRQVLVKLDSEIHTKEQRLEVLLKDERRLAELVRKLGEALAEVPLEAGEIPPFSSNKGRLAWPARGDIAARFGARRRLGKMAWRGVLIRAEEGEKVRAVYHGRVAFADWLRGFGLLIIVDHGNGYMSLYGHNQSLYKSVGEWVDKGDVVAAVGSSGGRSTAGLYFEIRHNGVPDDPLRWCRADAR